MQTKIRFKAFNTQLHCPVRSTSFAVRGDGVAIWVHDGIDFGHHMGPHYEVTLVQDDSKQVTA